MIKIKKALANFGSQINILSKKGLFHDDKNQIRWGKITVPENTSFFNKGKVKFLQIKQETITKKMLSKTWKEIV